MSLNDAIERLQSIRENCAECKGSGYVTSSLANGDVHLDDCNCVKEIIKRASLVQANIPERYWNWNFRNLTSQFKKDNAKAYTILKNYLEDLHGNLGSGKGFWLASPPGLAKSSIIAYLLREAIKLGYRAYFTRASHIITLKMDSLRDGDKKELLDFIVNDVDVLAIEEIEKVYLKSDMDFVNQAFYEILSDIYDSNKSLILTSNVTRKKAFEVFPLFIKDRLMVLDYLPLVGKSSGRHVSNG